MVGSVEQIKRDLAALEQAAMAIALDFRTTYTEYLSALEQTMRQQLVLASYRLCTQGYPERFLKLSWRQREQLQQALRQLGDQAHVQLMTPLLITPLEAAFETSLEDFTEEAVSAENFTQDSQQDAGDRSTLNTESADERDADEQDNEPDDEIEEFAAAEADSYEFDQDNLEPDESTPFAAVNLDFEQPMQPDLVRDWQKMLEQNTLEVLQTISHAANRLLQQANILPQKLPEPVLEIAAKSGMVSEAAGMPNLLNLLVETEEQEESKIRHIIAIHLRLSEIEFGDATLTHWRSKIRSLSARLNQIEREYRKKQRERAIAEAEAAWRSSWHEE